MLARRERPSYRTVTRLLSGERPLSARLSFSATWATCTAPDDRVACSNYQPNASLLGRATNALSRGSTAGSAADLDRLWALALIDLSARPDARHVDAIVARLATIVENSPKNAAAHNDLAVAYLTRNSIRGDGISAYQALDVIERAQRLDSTSRVIAFNRALMLERLHLYEESRDAWTSALALDSTSEWGREASEHRERLLLAARLPSFSWQTTDWDAEVQRSPQAAREWVLNKGLALWAEYQAHSNSSARGVAQTIARIARAIEVRSGDSTLLHVTEALDATNEVATRGVTAFSEAMRLYIRGDREGAAPFLERSSNDLRRVRADGLADWADAYLTGLAVSRSDFRSAELRGRRVARTAKQRHDIALEARVRVLLALADARSGNTAGALEGFAASATLYTQIGEVANAGSMLSQRGDILFALGRDDAAFDLKRQGLRLLAADRSPATRSGPLIALGRQLGDVGLDHAALAVLRESVRSAEHSERIVDLPEAIMRLVGAESAAGSAARARAQLMRARGAIRGVADSVMHDRLLMEVASAEAALFAQGDRGLATKRWDDVASYFRQRGILYDLPNPLVRAATLRLQQGDTTGAEQNLAEAASALETQRLQSSERTTTRALALATRAVYGPLVAIRLARGDTVGAFLLAERGRGNHITALPKLKAGRTVLAYSILGEDVVLWIFRDGHLRASKVSASATQLAGQAAKFERGMREENSPAALTEGARALFEILVAPASAEIEGARDLLIVPDGFVGRVPFAGLRGNDGTYLIERLPIMFATAVRGGRPEMKATGSLLLVANPAFDKALLPELAPLTAVNREVASIRRLYGKTEQLADAAATKAAFVPALGRAGVLHFAGHARIVDRAPSLSHLVLARASGGPEGNIVTAAEIQAMKLEHLQLVVLSACGTTQGYSRRDASENGLSDAFLVAGVAHVVSSLWEADDEGTATLMSSFHERLAAGHTPAEALRDAQLAMIRSVGASPHTWSAFRAEQR